MSIYEMIDDTYIWMMERHCPDRYKVAVANDNSAGKMIHNSILMLNAIFNFIRTLPKRDADQVLKHINMLVDIEIEERKRK